MTNLTGLAIFNPTSSTHTSDEHDQAPDQLHTLDDFLRIHNVPEGPNVAHGVTPRSSATSWGTVQSVAVPSAASSSSNLFTQLVGFGPALTDVASEASRGSTDSLFGAAGGGHVYPMASVHFEDSTSSRPHLFRQDSTSARSRHTTPPYQATSAAPVATSTPASVRDERGQRNTSRANSLSHSHSRPSESQTSFYAPRPDDASHARSRHGSVSSTWTSSAGRPIRFYAAAPTSAPYTSVGVSVPSAPYATAPAASSVPYSTSRATSTASLTHYTGTVQAYPGAPYSSVGSSTPYPPGSTSNGPVPYPYHNNTPAQRSAATSAASLHSQHSQRSRRSSWRSHVDGRHH